MDLVKVREVRVCKSDNRESPKGDKCKSDNRESPSGLERTILVNYQTGELQVNY